LLVVLSLEVCWFIAAGVIKAVERKRLRSKNTAENELAKADCHEINPFYFISEAQLTLLNFKFSSFLPPTKNS